MPDIPTIIGIIILVIVIIAILKIVKKMIKAVAIIASIIFIVLIVFTYLVYLDLNDINENFNTKQSMFIYQDDQGSALAGFYDIFGTDEDEEAEDEGEDKDEDKDGDRDSEIIGWAFNGVEDDDEMEVKIERKPKKTTEEVVRYKNKLGENIAGKSRTHPNPFHERLKIRDPVLSF